MTDTLHHYLDAWALAEPEALAETFTGTLYTVRMNGETAVLKLLKPVGIFDESPGAVALRRFNGQGAVRLLHYDERAHLLEYAAGVVARRFPGGGRVLGVGGFCLSAAGM